MSTALEKVQAALQVDVVVAAQEMIQGLDTFEPEQMMDADEQALVDRGTIFQQALKKLTEDRAEIHRGFDELKKKTTARLSAIIEDLTKAKAIAAEKWKEYHAIKARRAEAAAAEQQRLLDSAATSAPPADVEVAVPSNTTKGAIGQASGRKELQVKAVDLKLVAEHYPHLLVLDTAKAKVEVRAALVRDKEAKLPGLEYWYAEGTPSFGARR